jgi:hypothetical protein
VEEPPLRFTAGAVHVTVTWLRAITQSGSNRLQERGAAALNRMARAGRLLTIC